MIIFTYYSQILHCWKILNIINKHNYSRPKYIIVRYTIDSRAKTKTKNPICYLTRNQREHSSCCSPHTEEWFSLEFQNTILLKHSEGVQDMLLQNTAPWQIEYFKLKEFEKTIKAGRSWPSPCPTSLKQATKPSWELHALYRRKAASSSLKTEWETPRKIWTNRLCWVSPNWLHLPHTP